MLLALGLAAAAAVIDMQLHDALGKIYQAAFIIGCIGAICLVRRANLFGPMVQPPLIFAVTAVAANLLLAPASAVGGLRKLIFTVGIPLTSNFPTMGITTAITVALGLVRLFIQRDPNRHTSTRPPSRPARERASAGAPSKSRPTREPAADSRPRRPRPTTRD